MAKVLSGLGVLSVAYARKVVREDRRVVSFEGLQGDWTPVESSPNGMLACGVRMNVEEKNDESIVHKVQVKYCSVNNWKNQKEGGIMGLTSWGEWQPWGMCPPGTYLRDINLRVEHQTGLIEDTAANAINLLCSEL